MTDCALGTGGAHTSVFPARRADLLATEVMLRYLFLIPTIVVGLSVGGRADAQGALPAHCDAYTLAQEPGGVAKAGGQLTVVDRSGRRGHRIRGTIVSVERCEDVTGDDTPELIVSTNSGGQRCCTTFHVLGLGVPVRTLLQWEAGYHHRTRVRPPRRSTCGSRAGH